MRIRSMPPRRWKRTSGVALLSTVILIGLMLALSAAIVGLWQAEARVLEQRESSLRAFYFAEAAIEAARYEINETVDPDADGIGTRARSGPGWTYAVTSTPLGGDFYQLDATASVGEEQTTLQVVVSQVVTTRFPGGAISFVGDIEKSKMKFKHDPNIIIHGVDDAAISLTLDSALEELAEDFHKAVDHGDILPENFTGGVTHHFDKKGRITSAGAPDAIEMPMTVDPDYPVELEDVDALYDELTAKVYNTLIPSATVVDSLPSDHVTFGTEETPSIIYLPDKKTRINGQSLSGFGTLIVNELDIKEGSLLDWHGDIFVIGDDSKKAKITIDSKKKGNSTPARFELDGNLVVLGQASEDAEFKLKNGAEALIRGSVFVGTTNALTGKKGKKGKKAKFKVEKGGELEVEGLVTLMGRKVEAKFKDESRTIIHGALQIALPDYDKEELKFEFSGDLEIYKDTAAILAGAKSWDDLAESLNAVELGIILTNDHLETMSWTLSQEQTP